MRIVRARTLAAAVVVGGLAVAPLAAMMNLPGEPAVKRLVGINPDGCIVRNTGDGDDWRDEPEMPTLRDGPSAAVVGSSVYLVGGIASFDRSYNVARSVATFERFDTATGKWETLPPLPRALNHVALAAVGDAIYALGGETDRLRLGDVVAESWRYDIAARRWDPIAPMPTARGAAATAVLGHRIYVVGGLAGRASLETVESYDVDTDRWRREPPMSTRRNHLATAALDGLVYALGGRAEDEESVRTFERYDPRTGRWTRLADVPEPKAGFALLAVPGGLVAAGGENLRHWTLYGGVFRYDPATGRWSALPSMSDPRHGFGGAVVGDRLYVLGGSKCSGFFPSRESSSMRLP
jgi:N-acetylneuraminic acid mutarotase